LAIVSLILIPKYTKFFLFHSCSSAAILASNC
jgi:hypothetical protein